MFFVNCFSYIEEPKTHSTFAKIILKSSFFQNAFQSGNEIVIQSAIETISELVNALPENYATQCIPLASIIVQQYSDNSFVTQACVMKLIQNMLAKTGNTQLAEYSKTYVDKFFQTI